MNSGLGTTAEKIGCTYLILEKHRYGDRDVEVDMPDLSEYANHTPVLVDDIISTGRTMIKTAEHLREMGLKAPVCIGYMQFVVMRIIIDSSKVMWNGW